MKITTAVARTPPEGFPTFAPRMSLLEIAATDKTPSVRFDPENGTLEIIGCSIHENADRFYRPVLSAVESFTRMPGPRTTVRLHLTYFNSSSAKYILDLLRSLDDLHASGASKVKLEWLYDAEDLDMEEAGNDYKALLGMPVRMVRT